MNPGKIVVGIAAILALCLASPARAQITGFGGTGTNWTTNMAANSASALSVTNDILILGTNSGDANSAFYNFPQYIGQFAASFVFQNNAASDQAGFVFVLQNQGPTAVGAVGGNDLGYVGITNATGVAFNINNNGDTPGLGYAPLQVPSGGQGGFIPTGAVDFHSTNAITVNITYTNQLLTVTVRDIVTTNTNTFTTNFLQNLETAVGGTTAYVGFTGGGSGALNVTISNFVFNPGVTPTPLPPIYPVGLNGSNIIDVTKITNNETDGVIAFNPQNPANMFLAANTNVEAGLFGAYSTNSGTNWSSNVLGYTNPPPGAYPALAWDAYGNLFLAYADGSFSGIDLALSTNGGQNFRYLTNLATGHYAVDPRIAVGTNTLGGNGSVWVLYKDFRMPNSPLIAQGAAVSGTGAVGAFGLQQIVPGSTNDCGFGDLAIGPLGQVMVAYQTLYDSSGPADCYVSVDGDGLGVGGFGAAVLAAANAIGGETVIPAAPDGLGINAAAGLAWDTNPYSEQFNRAYLVCVGQGGGDQTDTDIFVCSSVNAGTSWSAQQMVNDDNGLNSKFMPRIAVDPTDGILAVSWYDCRNDTGVVTSPVVATNYGILVTNDPGDTPPTNFSTNFSTTFSTNLTYIITNLSTNYVTQPGPTTNQAAMFYGAVSLDGGNSFQANKNLSTDTKTGYLASLSGSQTDFGDYTGLAFYGGTFYPVWADNVTGTTNSVNPGPTNTFDIVVAPITLSGLADLSITAAVVNPTNTSQIQTNILQVGSLVDYLITVSNNGPNLATNAIVTNIFSPNVHVVIAFPTNTNSTVKGSYHVINGSTLVWNVGQLPNKTCATLLVETTAVGIGNALNFSSVTTPTGINDLRTNNNTCALASAISGADLGLSLSSSPTFAAVGGIITYTLVVTNMGPVADYNVIVTNTLPPNLEFVSATVPGGSYTAVPDPGNSGETDVIFTLSQPLLVGTNVTLTFTAQALSLGPAEVVAEVGNIVVNGVVTTATTQVVTRILPPDMAIGMVGSPSMLIPGQQVSYSLFITNLGPVVANGVKVVDTLPSNFSLVSASMRKGACTASPDSSGNGATDIVGIPNNPLSAGEISLMVITATAITPGTAENVAVISDSQTDTNLANNTAEVLTTVITPDMALGMTGSPSTVPVGQTIAYTLLITNLGPVAATNVTVTNILSAGLSFAGVSMPQGASYSANGNVVVVNLPNMTSGQTCKVGITALAVSAGSVTNSAVVGDSLVDSNPGNAAASVVSTVTTLAPISNVTSVPGVTGVFITWNTGYLSDSQVDYGVTDATNVSYLNPTPTNYHVVLLTGLEPDTNYVFQVRSSTPAVEASDATNRSVVSISVGLPSVLYTTNGAFSTTSSVILGTTDAAYSGLWLTSGTASAIFGNNYNYSQGVGGDASSSTTYTPGISVPGLYNISVWYPVKPGSFSSATPMIVNATTNVWTTNVNQTVNGGDWRLLAPDMYFGAATTYSTATNRFTLQVSGVLVTNVLTANLSINNGSGDPSTSVVANGARWAYDLSQDAPTNGVVPAWWAWFYFGTNSINSVADPDGDGYSTFREYVLGTDPTSKSSSLQFVVTNGPSARITAAFAPFQGGRVYQLQCSTNLSTPAWVTLTNTPSINTNNGTGWFTVARPAGTAVFFRLAASLAPNQ
jgi:uncharacterized repeat protein (TIGR01451 family)